MTASTSQQLGRILAETLSVLRHQGTLGLRGLQLADNALMLRPHGLRAELGVASPTGVPTKHKIPALSQALVRPSGQPQAASPEAPFDLEVRPVLNTVRQSLEGCARCKLGRTRTSIVFGTGNQDARLMFIGEAPGRDEDLQGEPFVGEAGRLLDRMIAAMGQSRQSVYIANVVKCRPPRNRDPEADEIMACEPFLRRQIAAIQPEVVVVLGRFAAQTLLCDKTPISRLRGQWRQYGQTKVMPTFHPAYLLHNPGDKKLVWQDLQQVMAQLGLSS